MPFCPYCGTEVRENDYECGNCHAPIKERPKQTYCSGCGAELPENAIYCSKCGKRTDAAPKKELPKNSLGNEITGECNVFLAIILSVIIPGLGTIYAGYVKDGLILLVAAVICGILGFLFFFPWIVNLVIWIYGIYDAYKKSDDSNKLWYQYVNSQ